MCEFKMIRKVEHEKDTHLLLITTTIFVIFYKTII